MRISSRPTGADAPDNRRRRPETGLESAPPLRLEGRFKDGRDRGCGPRPERPGRDNGDLRRAPRPEPRTIRNRP